MFETGVREDELWIGEMRGVVVDGRPVLLVRHEAGVCAYHDRCPHQGYPLSEGELSAGVVTCRVHQHRFDAVSGAGINPPRPCLSPLQVRVQDGQIAVQLEPAARRALP